MAKVFNMLRRTVTGGSQRDADAGPSHPRSSISAISSAPHKDRGARTREVIQSIHGGPSPWDYPMDGSTHDRGAYGQDPASPVGPPPQGVAAVWPGQTAGQVESPMSPMRQSDGSIIMEGVYIDTAHSGATNCQQVQLVEFRALVKAKSATKLKREAENADKDAAPPSCGECTGTCASNLFEEDDYAQQPEQPHQYQQQQRNQSLFDSYRMEDDLSQAETSRTAVSLSHHFTSETETKIASGDEDVDEMLVYDIAGLEATDEVADDYDDIDEFLEFDEIAAPSESASASNTTRREKDDSTIQTDFPANPQSARASLHQVTGGDVSPAVTRAQEECLGTSQAMLDAKFALARAPLGYGGGLQEF